MKKFKIVELKKKGFSHYAACLINYLIKNDIMAPDEVEEIKAYNWNYSLSDLASFIDYMDAIECAPRVEYDILKIIIDNGLSSEYIAEGEGPFSYVIDIDYLIDNIKETYYDLDKLPDFITDAIDWQEVARTCLEADYSEVDGVYFYDYI